jgi:hypothetical protein
MIQTRFRFFAFLDSAATAARAVTLTLAELAC